MPRTTSTKTKTTKSKVVESTPVARYYYAIGRRKTSVATVRLFEGEGESFINDKKVSDKSESKKSLHIVSFPLDITSNGGKFYFTATTKGGGFSAQIDALQLGIARALLKFDPSLKKVLKQNKLLTRDSREVERKKTGLRKARKSPQYSKR